MLQKLALPLLAVLVLNPLRATAESFTAQLDELTGYYSPFGGSTKQTTYDFGEPFAEVAAAILHLEGEAWNGNSPGPQINTTLYFTVDLGGVESRSSLEIIKKGNSVAYATDIPLSFDDAIVNGAGAISLSVYAFGAIDHFGAYVTSASLVFDALPLGTPGDFNLDGHVDAADNVFWRKNINTPEAYDGWRANFGNALGGGSTASTLDALAAVPEPSVLILSLLAACGLYVGRSGRSGW